MRIVCPFCGERGNEEFSYLGDASPVRPDPGGDQASQKFADYVYLRDNPRGAFRELWYHQPAVMPGSWSRAIPSPMKSSALNSPAI